MHDPPEFRDYVAAHRDRLVRFGWFLTGDHQSAEDLVQTALTSVWMRWERVSRGENVDAYIRRTMTTTHLTWRRRLWHRERPTDLTQDGPHMQQPDTSHADTAWEAREGFMAALGSLPRKQRTVLVLRYFLDLSEADCAAAMSCTTGTVKSQTARALRSLRTAGHESAAMARGRT